jgi:hypothetical protein
MLSPSTHSTTRKLLGFTLAAGVVAALTATLAVAKAPSPTFAPQSGIWLSPAEVQQLPTTGSAWKAVKAAADGSLGTARIADQDSSHDVKTLAVALVYARTGDERYRRKGADAVLAAVGTERGGRTLALGRNLLSYVVAADLVDLRTYDPAADSRFRTWLSAVRRATLDGRSLVSTHEERPNNWGTMAGASRIAADAYLGDTTDLARAAAVFKGFLGDRSSYTGFKYGDLSWQPEALRPVGVAGTGAQKGGVSIDGVLPDDMRRGCSFRMPPCSTGYPWEALQGAVVQAELLTRQGYDAWQWQDRALLRATQFLAKLDTAYGGWWASGDDAWQPWLVNHAYGTRFPAASPTRPGKLMGYTDWTHGTTRSPARR